MIIIDAGAIIMHSRSLLLKIKADLNHVRGLKMPFSEQTKIRIIVLSAEGHKPPTIAGCWTVRGRE